MHTAKATTEWLQDKTLNVLELNPIEHLWTDQFIGDLSWASVSKRSEKFLYLAGYYHQFKQDYLQQVEPLLDVCTNPQIF